MQILSTKYVNIKCKLQQKKKKIKYALLSTTAGAHRLW